MQKVLQSSLPDISGCSFGCNVFERRGVIERLEARSEVQLNSERIAAEAGSRPRLQQRLPVELTDTPNERTDRPPTTDMRPTTQESYILAT